MRKLSVEIEGMTCSSCVNTIETTIQMTKGVQSVIVSLATNSASVVYDENQASYAMIKLEVESVGFLVTLLHDQVISNSQVEMVLLDQDIKHLTMSVDGMTCTSCVSTVERTLQSLSGVNTVVVSLMNNSATLDYNSTVIQSAAIIDAVESVGFDAKVISEVKSTPSKILKKSNTINKSTVSGSHRTAVLGVEGMTCTSCSSTVERVLSEIRGVSRVESVNLSTNTATVHYDGSALAVSALVEAIEDVGFDAKMLQDAPRHSSSSNVDTAGNDQSQAEEKHLKTVLLTLASSAAAERPDSVEAKLTALRDAILRDVNSGAESDCLRVDSADVVSADRQLKVVFHDEFVGPRDLVRIADKLALEVTVSSFGGFMMAHRLLARQAVESKEYLRSVLLAISLTVPIVLVSMVLPMFSSTEFLVTKELLPGLTYSGILLLLLTTPVEFVVGYRFHKKAYMSLKSRTMGMDFMISTGSLAAYACSLFGMIHDLLRGTASGMDMNYFDTSAVLITAVLLGKYLETYARGQTASAIHKLTALKAKTARLVGTMPTDSYSDGCAAEEDCSSSSVYSPLRGATSSSDSEHVIDSALLHKHDVVRLVAGEAIPADGELLSGSHIGVDESMMTGESAMVSKKGGDSVFGGATVVEGSALMHVTALGEDSTLGKIVSTVQEAQTSKPPIQEFADKIALLFVPIVASISVGTFVVWMGAYFFGAVPPSWYAQEGSAAMKAFYFALAVWVSACPCAFGLATPTAVLVATGIAAKHGILVRRGAALQYAAEVNTVAFDKTGTLTKGSTEVSDFHYVTPQLTVLRLPVVAGDSEGPYLDDQRAGAVHALRAALTSADQVEDLGYVLRLLLAAEVRSSHPLARGITLFCKHALSVLTNKVSRSTSSSSGSASAASLKHFVPAEDQWVFDVVPGQGVHMHTSSSDAPELHVLVGSPKLLESRGVAVPPYALQIARSYRAGGKVAVYVVINGSLRAVVGVSDAVRPEAVFMIAALKKRGMRCYMVTGDEPTTARAIGATVGIAQEDILASAKPEDKEAFISALQARGARVAFVGDGTNDSPALARANVGLTMASGSDIAVEAGDMVLCKNDLIALVTALDLSRHTLLRIKLNYLWAFGYNVLLIPVAAGTLYPFYHFALQPMFAGAAMAVSSVSIVVSSLLLLLYQPPVVDLHSHSSSNHSSNGGNVEECNCPASTAPVLEEPENRGSFLGNAVRRLAGRSNGEYRRVGGSDSETAREILVAYREGLAAATAKTTVTKMALNSGAGAKSYAGDAGSDGERSPLTPNSSVVSGKTKKVVTRGCGCGKGNCKCGDACMCGTAVSVSQYGAVESAQSDV